MCPGPGEALWLPSDSEHLAVPHLGPLQGRSLPYLDSVSPSSSEALCVLGAPRPLRTWKIRKMTPWKEIPNKHFPSSHASAPCPRERLWRAPLELLHLQTTVMEGGNTSASAHISLLSLLLDGLSQTSQAFEFSPASCVITGQPLLAKQIAVS